MKNALLLFAFIIVLTSSTAVPEPLTFDLATALNEQKVSLVVKGNNESPHYYQPLIIDIKNLTHQDLIINIKNGQLFASNNPEIQDIITTQQEFITLKANKAIHQPLYGMCVQQFNQAPDIDQEYSMGELASGNLATLAGKIQEQKAFSIAGQHSVWAVTDDNDLEDIESYIPEDADELRAYVADLLDTPNPVIVRGETVSLDTGPKLIKRTVGGNFKYKFSKTSAVTIGMFNDQNIVVKELYNNPETAAGEHKLSYEFDTMVFPEDTYFIRLIIDGQIKINFKMKPRRG